MSCCTHIRKSHEVNICLEALPESGHRLFVPGGLFRPLLAGLSVVNAWRLTKEAIA